MPIESSYPKLNIPNVDLWSFLFERQNIEYLEGKEIYIDPETNRSYSYAKVKSTAIDFGQGLCATWDWKKGDVLCLYAPNCIDIPSVIWGVHWASGIISLANPGYTVDELVFQLRDSRAKALVTQKANLKNAVAACKEVGIPESRIVLLGDERDDTAQFKHFTDIRNTSIAIRRRSNIDPEKDLAFLVYSSGTTGYPKGVMLTHLNIVANVLQSKAGEGPNLHWQGGKNNQGDRILAFLPFFHIYGLTCLMHQAIYSGLELVIMPKFDLERFCSYVEKFHITYAYAVPPVILMLGKSPIISKYNLSSLRMLNSGAAPITHDIIRMTYDRLGIPVKQSYGLSETSPATHVQRWEDWNKTIGSVGPLLPNQTAKFLNAENEEVPAGQVGELCIKGPNIFAGYLNNPKGTKKAMTEDGYLKTGDIGYVDQEGNFYITDRVKELIKYKGFQVPPAELEGILLGNGEVDDVAVIGVYDSEQATEVPRAYIVPKKGVEVSLQTEKRIVEWLNVKVADHKRLRGGVAFVDQLPKSASGKILRKVLKELAKAEENKHKAKL